MSRKGKSKLFQVPRGMRDILPAEQKYWERCVKIAKELALYYGFELIETPILENAELFAKGVGAGTDIVEKEMYTLRTKGGEHNSYNLPDAVNRLDWTRKKEHYGVYSYYRDLIALRKAHPAFRMKTRGAVRENLQFYEEFGLKVQAPGIAYVLYGDKAGDSWRRIAVLVNPEKTERRFALPEGRWLEAFDEGGLVKTPGKPHSGHVTVEPLSLAVLRLAD